jgi:hypothetical protein
MQSLRQRAVRLAGALLMVALLLVPVVASAHTHRDLRAAGSCATCIAAHHSPAVVMPAVATAASIVVTVAPPLPSRVAPAHAYRSPRAGRAPPSPAPVPVG